MLEDTRADATTKVDELIVSKELVYPSLEAEVLARLPLAHNAHRTIPVEPSALRQAHYEHLAWCVEPL